MSKPKSFSFIIILLLLSSYAYAEMVPFNSDSMIVIMDDAYQPKRPQKPDPAKLNITPAMSFNQKEQELDRFYDYGRRLFKEQQYAQALSVYDETLKETEKLYAERPDRFKSGLNHLLDIHLQLAGYYRWKEHDPKKALVEYDALLQNLDQSNSGDSRIGAIWFLMGEIYEKELKQYEKARSCYQKIVEQLKSRDVKGEEALFMKGTIDWYAFLVDKIDVLYLQKSRHFPPRTMKYPSIEYSIFLSFFAEAMAFSTLSFIDEDFMNDAPDYYSLEAMNELMAKYPTSYQMMFFGISLFQKFLEENEIDKAVVVADKVSAVYPHDYPAVMLQFQVADIYKQENKSKSKAATKKGLKMAKALNIDMVLGTDERFSGPEKTWRVFKTALGNKDIDEAVSCFSPSSQDRYRELFTAMKDNLDKMAADMKPIDKVQEEEDRAKFRIHRTQNGHEITYYIYFVNILGEWKIDRF